jgi:general secretion pathway protein E
MYTLSYPKSRPVTASDMVDYIVALALKYRASDIHLATSQYAAATEPYLLRYRVHGKLQAVRADFIGNQYKEIISRVKVLAGMNIAENMVPQDGQIQVSTPDGLRLILRVATVPGQENEDVCIRVQHQNDEKYALDTLAMPRALKARLTDLIQQKSGMIVLNGPAGSGKTTTIYSILGTLATPDRKVITAEDPIESRLPYVCHTQVSTKTSFASLCRAFMRQDADVIFVGEVRDTESAEAAIQLAQTGHLVLTTLHTRDAIGVISRLEALEIHPNLIATTLVASLSQRLIQRLCPECRVRDQPDARTLAMMHRILPMPTNTVLYRTGDGCSRCVGGVCGRLPVFELFVVDGELTDMINRSAPKRELFEAARARGMVTLAEDALARVYGGYADFAAIKGLLGPEADVDAVPSPGPQTIPPRPRVG